MSEKTVRLKLATKDVETLLSRTASIERAIQQDDAPEVAVAAPTLLRTKGRALVSNSELKQIIQDAVSKEVEKIIGSKLSSALSDVGLTYDPDNPPWWVRRWPRPRPWPWPWPPQQGPEEPHFDPPGHAGPCPPLPGDYHDELEHSVFDTMQKLHSLSSHQDPAAIERVLNEALTEVREIGRRTATIK